MFKKCFFLSSMFLLGQVFAQNNVARFRDKFHLGGQAPLADQRNNELLGNRQEGEEEVKRGCYPLLGALSIAGCCYLEPVATTACLTCFCCVGTHYVCRNECPNGLPKTFLALKFFGSVLQEMK